MTVKVKSKKISTLIKKIDNAKNDVVVKYFCSHGIIVENSKSGIKSLYNSLKNKGKTIILAKENERLYKDGSYYIWEANVMVKED